MTCANVQNGQKKCIKLPANTEEETQRNKPSVDLIDHYKIRRKGKYPLILKAITMIDPVTGWFEVVQYSNKKAMKIANLVETTWLVGYPWTAEITYDQGGESLGNEF